MLGSFVDFWHARSDNIKSGGGGRKSTDPTYPLAAKKFFHSHRASGEHDKTP